MGLKPKTRHRWAKAQDTTKDRPKAEDNTRMRLLPLDKTKVGLRPEKTWEWA